MITNKKDLKREEIIRTAFSEWGKTGFRDTSLSSIALKMKVTKASLYRYFKNKEEIINSLICYFLKDYLKIGEKFIRENKNNSNLEEVVRNYINDNFTFFAETPPYLFFFASSMTMESILKNKEYIDQKKIEMDIFEESFKKSKSWIKSESVPAFMNHIFGTGLFLFFYAFDKKQSKDLKILDEEIIKNTIDKIYDITVKGFLNKKENIEIDFKSIENSCVVTKDDLPQKYKIFDAITSVVAKVGVWNASLDMIAKEAGMSKSSFYFYFANKEEMFGNIVIKEIEKTNDMYIQKSDNYKSFYEKIYSNIVIETTYMLSDIRIMYFFNWLHYQKINLKVNKKISKKAEEIFTERFSFIREAIENKVLKSYDFGFMEIASFTKMQIVKEILISTIFERTINEENFRNIYKLFLVGIYE